MRVGITLERVSRSTRGHWESTVKLSDQQSGAAIVAPTAIPGRPAWVGWRRAAVLGAILATWTCAVLWHLDGPTYRSVAMLAVEMPYVIGPAWLHQQAFEEQLRPLTGDENIGRAID